MKIVIIYTCYTAHVRQALLSLCRLVRASVCDMLRAQVRAEDGRAVSCVDLSPFINNLPFEVDSVSTTTVVASKKGGWERRGRGEWE